MITRAFGSTGVHVSALGFGAGAIGDARITEREAEAVLLAALDCGVTLFDTAPSYGLSEERIGRYLAPHVGRVVISTKGGYGTEGVADWTGEAIERGVDAALSRMRIERLGIFHLHSCPRDVLERGDILDAVSRVAASGKVGSVAYSGENDALAFAVECGRFGSVQCSVNPFDQWSSTHVIPGAAARGIGVIGKRPVANAPWRFSERPVGDYAEVYWERMRVMRVSPEHTPERAPEGYDWASWALRFSAFSPGVSSVIVGTSSQEHLRENARAIERGPLSDSSRAAIEGAFRAHGEGWRGEV